MIDSRRGLRPCTPSTVRQAVSVANHAALEADASELTVGQLVDALVREARGWAGELAAVQLLVEHGHWLSDRALRGATVAWFTAPQVRRGGVTVGVDDAVLLAQLRWEQVVGWDLAADSDPTCVLLLAAELAGWDSGHPLVELVGGLDESSVPAVVRSLHATRAGGPQQDVAVSSPHAAP